MNLDETKDLLGFLKEHGNTLKTLGDDLERLLRVYSDMVATLVPFKPGDRAKLVRDIGSTLNPGHGWYCSRKMLVPGCQGEIVDVEWNQYRHAFAVGFLPDNQTWTDADGIEHPLSGQGGIYYVSPSDLIHADGAAFEA